MCFGVQFLLHKPDEHSYWEAGRTDSVFLSFLAMNDLFSICSDYCIGHTLASAHSNQNLDIVKSDQKECFRDE